MTTIDLQTKIIDESNIIELIPKYPNIPNIQYKFQMHISMYQQNIANLRPLGSNTNTNQAYYRKFHTPISRIKVKDLKYGTMYHIQVKYKWGAQDQQVRNVYCTTPMEKMQDLEEQEQEYSMNFHYERSQVKQNTSLRSNSSRNRHSQKSQINDDYKQRINRRSQRKQNSNIKNRNQDLCNSQMLMRMIGQSERVGNKDKVNRLMLQARKCRNIDQFINEKSQNNNRQETIKKKMMITKGMLLFDEIYKYRQGHQFFKNDWHMGPFYSYNKNQQENRKY